MSSGEREQSATFGEFIDLAAAQAVRLTQRGLARGDTLILILPQGIELMAAFVGAMMVGAIPTILAYPNFKVEPGKYRFGLSGATKNLRARLIVLDAAFPDDLLAHVDTRDGAEVVRADGAGVGATVPALPDDPDDVAFIQHSAGTTGLQKAVAMHYFDGARPTLAEIRTLGEKWQPYRSVATWYLWRSLDPIPVEY